MAFVSSSYGDRTSEVDTDGRVFLSEDIFNGRLPLVGSQKFSRHNLTELLIFAALQRNTVLAPINLPQPLTSAIRRQFTPIRLNIAADTTVKKS